MLFTSYSGTLWWYSKKTRNDGIHVYSLLIEGVHLSQMNFVEFSIHFGEWIDSGEEKRMTKLDKQSSSHLWINSVTTQMKRNFMVITLFLRRYITKLVGNAIKMQYIGYIYPERRIDHHQRHSAKRLHRPCDFSELRSSDIREGRNTKASTQGYVKEQLAYKAKATTAAAAAYARGRR